MAIERSASSRARPSSPVSSALPDRKASALEPTPRSPRPIRRFRGVAEQRLRAGVLVAQVGDDPAQRPGGVDHERVARGAAIRSASSASSQASPKSV